MILFFTLTFKHLLFTNDSLHFNTHKIFLCPSLYHESFVKSCTIQFLLTYKQESSFSVLFNSKKNRDQETRPLLNNNSPGYTPNCLLIDMQLVEWYHWHLCIHLAHHCNNFQSLCKLDLEDARFIVYEDEREVIATYVSICKGNHIKAN